jgi:hypothetical protein
MLEMNNTVKSYLMDGIKYRKQNKQDMENRDLDG